MKGKWLVLLMSLILALSLSTGVSAKEKVTVYTSLETDETVKYLEVARKDLPDLDIDIIRLSTGELGAGCWQKRTTLRPIVSGDGP